MTKSGIGTKIAKGAVWMVLFKLIERSLGIISTVILARLLVPEDFGLIAMAMSIIAVLELMGSFGFDMALIQNQDATRDHYDTAWTFNVIFAAISALLLVAIAMPAANFYQEERLDNIIYFLALGTFIFGFENIGVVAFRKDLEFNKEFKFLVGKKIASFAVTVPLAFILQTYWALVFGILTGKIASVLLSYYVHHYRPKFCMAKARELFHFSKWLLFNNVLFFLRLHSADFIIGRLVGAHQLGLYTVAFEISNMPTSELIAPINRAVYPGYSKIAKDPDALRHNFLNVIALITLFALPAGLGIAVTADPIVKVAFGIKWLEAIPMIQILALYGVITAVQTNIVYIYLAIGKPRITTALATLYILLLLPAIVWLCRDYGAIGAAWAYLGVSILLLPINFIVIFRHLNITVASFASTVWRPIFAAVCMFFLVNKFLAVFPPNTDFAIELLRLISSVSLGAISYVIILLSLWILSSKPEGAEQSVIEKILPRLPSVLRFSFLMPVKNKRDGV